MVFYLQVLNDYIITVHIIYVYYILYINKCTTQAVGTVDTNRFYSGNIIIMNVIEICI